MKTWMRTDRARRIVIILAVTIVLGWLGTRVIHNRIVGRVESKNACINNLYWIAGAKELLAKEKGLKPGASVDIQDVAPYVLDGWRDCPAGGTYTMNPIETAPTCSISGHTLPK
jgi:hypothetical protein